jgi:hypothetical protein
VKDRESLLADRELEIEQLLQERDALRTETISLSQAASHDTCKAKIEELQEAVEEERNQRMKVEGRALEALELFRGIPSKVARAVTVLQRVDR